MMPGTKYAYNPTGKKMNLSLNLDFYNMMKTSYNKHKTCYWKVDISKSYTVSPKEKFVWGLSSEVLAHMSMTHGCFALCSVFQTLLFYCNVGALNFQGKCGREA